MSGFIQLHRSALTWKSHTNSQILLLLGRDVLKVHKVRDQNNGPDNAPYAQILDLGWVMVGEVCHKPNGVSAYSTNVLENGHHSHFSHCQNAGDRLLRIKIFRRTKDDSKVAPFVEDKQYVQLRGKEKLIDDANGWVAPLPLSHAKACHV